MAENTYWAADATDKFLPRMFEKVDHYYRHVMARGWLWIWRASHKAAYAGWYTGGRMNEVGPNGKFTSIEANDYANLKTHILNLITAQRSQPEAQAKNMDHDSQAQTVIANGIAETVRDEKGLERHRQQANDYGLLYGEAWGAPLWDPTKGEIHATELDEATGEEKPIRTGDVDFRTFHPLDVVRDVNRAAGDDHTWLCTRRPENRYSLMAQYPEMADKIAVLPSFGLYSQESVRPRLLAPWGEEGASNEADDVAVWDFYHAKTPALEGGRMVTALDADVCLFDGPLPYRKIPLTRWSAQDIEGTCFGYSLFFDLLALQQGVNAGLSAVTSRVAAGAVANFWGPEGSKLQMTQLGEGFNILEGGTVKPEMLEILNGDAQKIILEYVTVCRSLMSTYSGINDVARGRPQQGITAASALALLEARAVQFVALSQKADIAWTEGMYSGALHNYQDMMADDAEYLITVVGASNKSRVESFMRSDVAAVSGYTMKLGNPLQGTVAGRMQIVEGAKGLGINITLEQYWQVMTTGRLDPVTESPQKEMELIRAENEAMSNGGEIQALLSDNHPVHLREHASVLADPESRKNPGLVQSTLSHIQEHEDLWIQATVQSPSLLAAKNIPPAPLPPPVAMPPPGPGGPPGIAGPPAGPPNGGKPMNPAMLSEPISGGPPVRVHQAQPARNPMTGAPNPHPMAS